MKVSRLRSHLDQIKRDDRLIKNEGIEALSEEELRQACRVRGMRAPFGEGATMFMRKQLKEWLDLSLNRQATLACRWTTLACKTTYSKRSEGRGLELPQRQEGN